jgi:hypothetical protein
MNDEIADRAWNWLLDPNHALEGLLTRESTGLAVGIAHVRAFYDRYTGGPSDFIMYQWNQG